MSLKDLATMLIMKGVEESDILKKYDYLPGKSRLDINDAVKRGLKNGMGKIEFEIDAVEANLKKVLVRRK